MIDLARQALNDVGLLPLDAPARYNFLVKRHVQIQVFANDNQFFNLKFSRTESVAREHDAVCEVFSLFPTLVAEPLALVASDPFEISICRGVAARRLSKEAIEADPPLFIEAINDYTLRAKSGLSVEGDPAQHRQFVVSVLNDLPHAPFREAALGWLSSGGARTLEGLPYVKQHGDFGRTNLGFADGRIVVFDWEEFGSVLLPGYDVLLLVASQLELDAGRIERVVREGAPAYLGEIVDFFCTTYNMAKETFLDLIPMMFVIFLHAKETRGYRYKRRQYLMDTIQCLFGGRD